jgi:hypothetical protein
MTAKPLPRARRLACRRPVQGCRSEQGWMGRGGTVPPMGCGCVGLGVLHAGSLQPAVHAECGEPAVCACNQHCIANCKPWLCILNALLLSAEKGSNSDCCVCVRIMYLCVSVSSDMLLKTSNFCVPQPLHNPYIKASTNHEIGRQARFF